MRAWLSALRIARREARRAKGRSALVVALIGLPVLGFSFAAVTYDTFTLTRAEQVRRDIGAADAQIGELYDGPIRQSPTWLFANMEDGSPPTPRSRVSADDVRAALPPGSRVIEMRTSDGAFRTAAGQRRLATVSLDYADPIAAGILVPLAGRPPVGDSEVALTPQASKRVGAGLGGTLASADGTRTWRVVGLVEDPGALGAETVVLPAPSGDGGSAERTWLADTPAPLLWADVRGLNAKGVLLRSRAVLIDPPPFDPATMIDPPTLQRDAFAVRTVLAGVLVLEVVLLAGPAFAVGSRRRRRDLALVAASGGSPAHLRRIVLADGVVLGTVAAAAGLVLGGLVAVVGRDLVAEYVFQARPGALRLYPQALCGLAVLAVLAGTLAALVPAWTAARVPVVAALAGRFTATGPRRRWLVLGLVVVAAGVAVTVYGANAADETVAMAGMVIGELGLVMCTPTLVALIARLGVWLPLPIRIALRDTGRNRAAAAPAICAVLAAVAVATLAAVLLHSNDRRYTDQDTPLAVPAGWVTAHVDTHAPGPENAPPPAPPAEAFPALDDLIRANLPVRDVIPFGELVCADGVNSCFASAQVPAAGTCPYWRTERALTAAEQRAARADSRCDLAVRESYAPTVQQVVIDPGRLDLLIELDPATRDAAVDMLRAGGVLVADPWLVSDGHVALQPVAQGAGGTDRPPVRLPALALPGVDSPELVLGPAAVSRLGLTSRPGGFIVATTRAPTEAEEEAFMLAARTVKGSWQIGVNRLPEPQPMSEMLILAIAAGVITIAAAAIASGLAAVEGRTDLSTLAAVGASPGIRRVLSLSRTGIVAGLGSVLGLAAGLGAAAAVITGTNRATANVWPTTDLPLPFAVPWLNIAVSLLVVPAVAMLSAGVLTRSRLPIERVS